MKGIILAGGLGTRMLPCTRVTNKHCLPVYNKPMIFYPLETLIAAGLKEILLVTGGNNPGDFLKLLGNGKEFGLKEIHYAYQEGAGGIADALNLAKDFSDGQKIVVILGDNIFEDDFIGAVQDFEKQNCGAKFFLKSVANPERFGVAEIQGNQIISIEEKPQNPKSNLAVTGIYMYDDKIWDIISTLKPSARGELEITDVNNRYIQNREASYQILNGFWSDAGTFDSLLRTANLLARKNLES